MKFFFTVGIILLSASLAAMSHDGVRDSQLHWKDTSPSTSASQNTQQLQAHDESRENHNIDDSAFPEVLPDAIEDDAHRDHHPISTNTIPLSESSGSVDASLTSSSTFLDQGYDVAPHASSSEATDQGHGVASHTSYSSSSIFPVKGHARIISSSGSMVGEETEYGASSYTTSPLLAVVGKEYDESSYILSSLPAFGDQESSDSSSTSSIPAFSFAEQEQGESSYLITSSLSAHKSKRKLQAETSKPTSKPKLKSTSKPASKPTTSKPTTSKPTTRKPTTRKPTTSNPTQYCFPSRATLKIAVDSYISQNCATITTCTTRNQYGEIGTWCVKHVTDMRTMFWGASSFNSDISRWDVSSVTDMYGMFYGASSFNSNLSKWDVSSVNDTMYMFIKL
jgi:surface protein